MADEAMKIHIERFEKGIAIGAVLFASTIVVQILWHGAKGAPDVGGWLPWDVAAAVATALWASLYIVGWLINDALPLLHQRYEQWATKSPSLD